MNTSTLYRDLTCGMAAALITLVFGMTFVSSTAAVPGAHVATMHFTPMRPTHAWFGQPEPAVLVD